MIHSWTVVSQTALVLYANFIFNLLTLFQVENRLILAFICKSLIRLGKNLNIAENFIYFYLLYSDLMYVTSKVVQTFNFLHKI